MQMLSTFLVIVSAVLVGQAMAAVVSGDGTLIVHPQPTEELTRQELLFKLNGLKHDDTNRKVPVSVQVADLLYRANDKASTKVIVETTVAELIEQNNFQSLAECSQAAFKKRADVWQRTPRGRNLDGIPFGVHVYLLKTLHLAVENCLKNLHEVIDRKINDQVWLSGLALSFMLDGSAVGGEPREIATVNSGMQSLVVLFIEGLFDEDEAKHLEQAD